MTPECEDVEKRDYVAYVEGYNTALGRPSVPYNHLDKRSPFKQWWDKTYKGKGSEVVDQEKLWLEVIEVFARHYEAYNYPMQAIKECKTKFTLTSK